MQFRFDVAAKRIERVANGLRVTLSDDSRVDAELVLSAIGLRPRTALAQAAGLAVNRGVVADRWLATSAPHVYAIGDCAEVEGHTLPYVLPLMQQGRALAATLAGTPTPVIYPAMPVTVKTPACPTVVCPPPINAATRFAGFPDMYDVLQPRSAYGTTMITNWMGDDALLRELSMLGRRPVAAHLRTRRTALRLRVRGGDADHGDRNGA